MKFSIIVPHYDGCITDDQFIRGINCLINQTYHDFEVLIYHDGPTSRPIPEIWKELGFRGYLEITEKRENNWGHGNRDRGIKKAEGEYIVHFNPDNILYPRALEVIAAEIRKTKICCLDKKEVPNNIIIFPVIMRSMLSNGKFLWRDKDSKDYMIFSGYPPVRNNIDCMQLVMKTSLWRSIGGWVDKTVNSDGNMYQQLVANFSARYCSEVLGEHW